MCISTTLTIYYETKIVIPARSVYTIVPQHECVSVYLVCVARDFKMNANVENMEYFIDLVSLVHPKTNYTKLQNVVRIVYST